MDNKRPSRGSGPGSQADGEGQAKKPKYGESQDIDTLLEEFAQDEDEGPLQPDEDVELETGEAGRNWTRPPVPTFDPKTTDLVFQQLEVDYYLTSECPLSKDNGGTKPVVRMYGVTDAGNSVCLFVHGFEPYFYVEAPQTGICNEELDSLQKLLNSKLANKAMKDSKNQAVVLRIEREQKASIWSHQGAKMKTFLKIVVAVPNQVTPCRSLFEAGLRSNEISAFYNGVTTYESNVLFALRVMIDKKVVGGSWITAKAGKYVYSPKPLTWCQIEAHVHHDDFESHAPEGEWSRIAPFRILSVDIECAGRKGHFPDAKIDPVIQVANMITVQGQSKPVVRNVMTLGSCASIVGAEVMSFDSEQDMLKRWRDLLLEADPDVIIGYNIINFDLPYLFDRAKALKIESEFHYWGRVRGMRSDMKDTQFSSKAYGTHDYKDITIPGRVQLDIMVAVQREYKLASYSLNAVSAHFLGEQKEDVHHSIISDLQNGNEETRRRLAVYCLKDAYLPQRLLDKLMIMYNNIEMARVTGVPMSYLITKGQSIKVFSQLLRKARDRDLLLPNIKVQGIPSDQVGYEGATVLDPKVGYYDKPVATLDFASLYPSIMMAHNLCYSTLVPAERVSSYSPEDITRTPSNDVFVKPNVYKGVLPEILEELLGARKRAKADLKAETDPFKRAVLDGRQLALKISANSVYGFTGATIGKMPCLAISASTTAFGRTMILYTREKVQDHFTQAHGYEADCEVIYGDTDSVMVNFKVTDIKRAMELGKEAADYISATFPRPVKLEFEKVYFPYLLMNKKRYAGLLWTQPDKFDKMDSKGIETVRRDNCLLVKDVVTTCLEYILIKRDVKGAENYAKQIISDLLQNKVDLSLLVISKSLSKEADSYDNTAAHVELAKKMKKRDPATAPQVGDRVPYVIIKAAKGAKAYEKAEDPIYALENNLPIDTTHYLEHQLSQPLTRIFEAVMPNPKELLTGDHTRSITISTPSSSLGGIMKFAKVKLSCLGCKAPLTQQGETSLCQHCKPKESTIYQKTLGSVATLESCYNQLWSQCQRCQGSLHLDVLCTSRDCPIFYRRKKVQKDLNEAQTALSRFEDW